MAASGSPHSPRPARSSRDPWSQVVRGGADPIPAPEQSDRSPPPPPKTGDGDSAEHAGDGGIKKKPVWNKPSNGAVEVAVMDAVSWPPLSESARASGSPKPSASSESVKAFLDVSVPPPPAPEDASPSPKAGVNHLSLNQSPNHAAPAGQKSMKRGGGGTANGGPRPASAETQQIIPETQAVEPFPKDGPSKNTNNNNNNNSSNNNWEHGTRGGGFAAQSHGGGDHQRGFGGNRRGSNAGGAPHHGGGGHGHRRDPDRGGHEWSSRSFVGRDVHMHPLQQQRGVPRSFIRAPPPPPPPAPLSPSAFIAHPPVRPFMAPMGFQIDMPSPMFLRAPAPPEALRTVPFVTPMVPPVFYPPPDLDIRLSLVKQIDYYFSPENLIKDSYLRQNMDHEGWVPISLIASFPRVKNLAEDVQFILDVIRVSNVVEVKGDKIRKCNDWMNWILPHPPHQYGTASAQNSDALSGHLQSMVLEEGVAHAEGVLGRSASGNLSNQFRAGDQKRNWNRQAA